MYGACTLYMYYTFLVCRLASIVLLYMYNIHAHTHCYTVMDKVPSAYALLGQYFSNGQVEGNADAHAIASPTCMYQCDPM